MKMLNKIMKCLRSNLKCCTYRNTIIRTISALYITGDKATENYAALVPFMDFKNTMEQRDSLEYNLSKRKMNTDLNAIYQQYRNFLKSHKQITEIEKQRIEISQQLKMLKKTTMNSGNESEINELVNKGKQLKNDLKQLKQEFYPLEDEFVHNFLKLPNDLHYQCPLGDYDKILYRFGKSGNEECKSHLDYKECIKFIDNTRYYLMDEAAEFDVFTPQALTRYFLVKAGFIQAANPDFVRSILLEANATPVQHYYQVMEQNLVNKLNPAFLVGGASFESFLPSITKLSVFKSVLPLRMISCGRLYEKNTTQTNRENLFTAIQNNAVQTFVATANAQDAEEQMDNILNLCVDFYKLFNIHFQIVYVPASKLTIAENLRAEIQLYSPYQDCYISAGHISNYGDFVSKRILFTIRPLQNQQQHHFPHLIGGPILYASRLIASLLEHQQPFITYKEIVKQLNIPEKFDIPANNENDQTAFRTLFT